MPLKYIMPCLIIFVFACVGLKPAQPISQGVAGYIYLMRGNQMPSPDRPANKGRGVSREIYIYEPTTLTATEGASPLFSHLKTRLIAQTKSDSTGRYAIKLPAGNYSVFIKDEGYFFATESDDAGILNPLKISGNTITQRDFIVNYRSSY